MALELSCGQFGAKVINGLSINRGLLSDSQVLSRDLFIRQDGWMGFNDCSDCGIRSEAAMKMQRHICITAVLALTTKLDKMGNKLKRHC